MGQGVLKIDFGSGVKKNSNFKGISIQIISLDIINSYPTFKIAKKGVVSIILVTQKRR